MIRRLLNLLGGIEKTRLDNVSSQYRILQAAGSLVLSSMGMFVKTRDDTRDVIYTREVRETRSRLVSGREIDLAYAVP